MNPALSLDHVSVSFRARRRPWQRVREINALRDVSLAVGPGECLAVLGPNGAGKSTLLRLAAGLLSPTTGSVLLGGIEATEPGAQATWLPREERSFVLPLTATQNLRFFAHLSDTPNPTRAIRDALSRVGLEAEAERPVRGFSAGMRQRLAWARAQLLRSSLLLLDEALTSLDERWRAQFELWVHELREADIAILFATHDEDLAERLSTRVVHLNDGAIVGPL